MKFKFIKLAHNVDGGAAGTPIGVDPVGVGEVADIAWPAIDGHAGNVGAVLKALIATERQPVAEILSGQMRQLQVLACYAARHSPHFAVRLQKAGLQPSGLNTPEALRKLPPLTRRDLMLNIDQISCKPEDAVGHGPFGLTQTSGSSGEPVKVQRSFVNQSFWLAYTMREHLWHRRDFNGRLAIIRANLHGGKTTAQDNWGEPVSLFTESGPAYGMMINNDIAVQVTWLNDIKPHYLMVYPNNLAALLDEVEAGRLSFPNLKQVRSIAETLSADLRARAERILRVGVADIYSSQELGMIAAQCPVSGLYHVMEGVVLEVVDVQGQPCAEGQVGRVLLTDLHNYITPLFRYDISDYAEVGPACTCGRGLPTLRRIVGRERNLLKIPDGRRHWPLVGFQRFREIGGILQYQLIQRSLEEIEVRLVCEPQLNAEQEAELRAIMRKAMGYDFKLNFVYFENQLPRGANGKFDEFVCEA